MIWAFFLRDFRVNLTYKLGFFLETLGIFLFSFMWFYVAKIVNPAVFMEMYGVDYYSFVVFGFAFFELLQFLVQSMSSVLRDAQTTGVLESILVTPVSIGKFIAGSMLYPFVKALIKIIVYIIVAFFVFGVRLPYANWFSVVVIVLISLVSFAGLGALIAAITLVTKQDFSAWFMYVFRLVSNLLYPLAILPVFVQSIAKLLPVTPYLDGIRLALFQGFDIGNLSKHLLQLGIFGAILLPLGLLVFWIALRYVKRTGSLTEF